LSRNTEATPTAGVIDNPDIEILRDDMVELLYGATRPKVEYLFGTASPHSTIAATRSR